MFERVAASLKPGGRFAWNAFAFDHSIAARLDGQRQEEPVPHSLRYVPAENRVDITLDNGGTTSLWWATKNEWLGLIDVAGLEVEALYGWFDRRPFDEESQEYVWVARKPAGLSAYDSIAELYDPWSRSVTEDVPFYVAEAHTAGGPIVELGVGTGRIAIPIAASGVDVIGVDSSPGMLEVCRARPSWRASPTGSTCGSATSRDRRSRSVCDS